MNRKTGVVGLVGDGRWYGILNLQVSWRGHHHPRVCTFSNASWVHPGLEIPPSPQVLVDRPTQLICICILIFIFQQTNTKDIGGQFATQAPPPPPHP